MKKLLLYCFLLVLLTAAAGCSPQIKKLEIVEISDVRVNNVSGDTLDFIIAMDVRNTYSSNARVRDLSFDLFIAGDYLGKGVLPSVTELPGKKITTLDIPLSVRTVDVTERQFAELFGPKIRYSLKGFTALEAPIKKSRIELDVKGSVPAPNPIRLTLMGRSDSGLVRMKDRDIDFKKLLGKNARVQVDVRNPFTFSIPVSEFTYSVGAKGEVLAEGRLSEPVSLKPGENKLSIPVKVYPMKTFMSLLQGLVDGDEFEIDTTGSVLMHREEKELQIQYSYSR